MDKLEIMKGDYIVFCLIVDYTKVEFVSDKFDHTTRDYLVGGNCRRYKKENIFNIRKVDKYIIETEELMKFFLGELIPFKDKRYVFKN